MAKIGADIGQLQALKTTFDRQATTVGELMRTIDQQLNTTWWIGPAADKFKGDWESGYKRSLTNLQQALQGLAKEVDDRRVRLEQAGS